jgi:hypothetical protein
MKLDVRHCARCDKTHMALSFMPLSNPPPDVSHWAMCPQTHQPILLTITKHDESTDTTTLTTANPEHTHGDLTHGASS